MAYKVGMLDTDPAYQKSFMEYLNLRATIPIRLFTFSSPERLAEFQTQNSLDLLLVGDEMAQTEWNMPWLVLTKHREDGQRERYLFRYQSMDVIVRCILEDIEKNRTETEYVHAFFAVYSPLGRCGKTQYAKNLCARFEKSLYVNWEGISSEAAGDGQGSWLIYCMKSRNEECFRQLQVQKGESVPPPDSYQDIAQVEKGDLEWFRDTVKKKKIYDAVVFDIGSTVLCGYQVLEVFDRIYVPTLDDPVSKSKLKEFVRMYEQELGDASGLQYVQN